MQDKSPWAELLIVLAVVAFAALAPQGCMYEKLPVTTFTAPIE